MFAGYRRNEDLDHPAAEMLQLLHEAGCDTQDERELKMGLTACQAALLVWRRMSRKPSSQPGPKARAGRNEPCPCGSGKKYKKCCLDTDRTLAVDNDLRVKFGPGIVPRIWDVDSVQEDSDLLSRIMDDDPAFADIGFEPEKIAAFLTSLDNQDPLLTEQRDEKSSPIDDLAVRYIRESGQQHITRGIEDKFLAAAARAQTSDDVRALASGVCLAMVTVATKDPADDLLAIILFRKALHRVVMSMHVLNKVLGEVDDDDINRFIDGAGDPAVTEKISSAFDQLSPAEQEFIEAEYDKSYDALLETIAAGEFPVPPPFATQLALLGKLTLSPSKKDMPDVVVAFSEGLVEDDYVVYGQMLDRWLDEHEGSSDRIAEVVMTMRQLCMTRSIADLAPRLLVHCLRNGRWEAFDEEEKGFVAGPDRNGDMQAFIAEYGSWLRTKGYSAMADRLTHSWEGELPDAVRVRVA